VAKREAVTHLKAVMGLSERRACQIISADRKMIRYRSCRPPEIELRLRLRDLSNERRRFLVMDRELIEPRWGDSLAWDDSLFGAGMLCGLCSQKSITLSLLLNENGVRNARAYGVNGHVIVKFNTTTERTYLVDPDYGKAPYRTPADPEAFKAIVRDTYKDSPFKRRNL
jgi:hypothetical protein